MSAAWIGFSSYFLWGFFPIYWKLLRPLPALEILSHRVVWGFFFYLGIYLWSGFRRGFNRSVSVKQLALMLVAALLITANWGVYIYGVNSGRILETSLAYFLNPLMSVAVGVIFFREAFPLSMKLAVSFAAAGISFLIASQLGHLETFPWISLILATTFCLYGIVKKTVGLDVALGSLLEGAFVLVPGLIAAIFFRQQASVELTGYQWGLLLGSGVITGLPLFLFAVAAPQLPVSLMGMMQFVAPSLQFLVGILVYGEKLSRAHAVAFGLVWLGVGFYLTDRVRQLSRRRKSSRPT